MPTPTDDRRDLVTVVARMRAKPGKEAELRRELEALVEPTTRDEGYVNYDLHVGAEDDRLFVFYENWESDAALDAHLRTPHIARLVERAPELLDGELDVQRLRRIA